MPLYNIGTGRSLYKSPAVVVAGASSTWGDHGTNVTLSTTTIADDTATGVANSFSSVRGTQAYSTGKHYFEVKILTAPAVANFIIGLMDDTTANGAAMDDRILVNSAGHIMFNGQLNANGWTGTNLGAAFSLADNDVMAVAADLDNEFYYLALNNVWFLSGDPTSGATGTGAVGNGARTGARPMLSLWGVPAFSGTHQLITNGAAFIYTPPSGYSAWG